MNRRKFLKNSISAASVGMALPFWSSLSTASAMAQQANQPNYKAVVLITLCGGNDHNNMFIPMDPAEYAEYFAIRSNIAIPQASCIPVVDKTTGKTYGFHPALVNTARAYSNAQALLVANVGQLNIPLTKAQIQQNYAVVPTGLGNHTMSRSAWESAQNVLVPDSGWGGRIADYLSNTSGLLPSVLSTGPASIFTSGRTVQGVSVPTSGNAVPPVPSDMNTTMLQIAQNQISSANALVSQVAHLHAAAQSQQVVISSAVATGGSLKTTFPQTAFGQSLNTIALLLAGRSVVGASRQLFYAAQGLYDTHANQPDTHAANLKEFDDGMGAFLNALAELNLSDEVLVCTHSDFGRTFQSNVSLGSDHGWGSHQLIFGGGMRGGRVVGTLPEPELGGADDLSGSGLWIPTLSVTQMTASFGSWMGLNSQQLNAAFPDLANFETGPISLT